MRLWQLELCGAALTALLLWALFPPWNLAFLAPVALTPLLYVLAHEPFGRTRFLWAWLCGTFYWGLTCYWIQAVLAEYGGLNLVLSWLALALFAAAKGLILGVFGWAVGFALHRPFAIPAVAAAWTGLERLNGPQGFAWLTLGNAGIGMGVPLRLAPYTGVYGLSFVFAALATGATLVLLKRNRRELLWLAPLALAALLPAIELKKAPAEEAAVLQPAVKDHDTWTEAEKLRAFRQFSLTTLAQAFDPDRKKPALLIWPEVPAPFYYYADAEFRSHVTKIAQTARAPFLFGGVAFTPAGEPLNSAFFLTEEGRLAGRYDKIKLVPFGEFIPPLFHWIEKISTEAGNYRAGERVVIFNDGQHGVSAFICYESAFPDLVRQFARDGGNILVNLTNDGYFGHRVARQQHLFLVRMRAVENQRWLLRVANDGITASVDPAGRLWDQLPPFQSVSGRLRFDWSREITVYSRFGDWFAWLCLALGLGLSFGSYLWGQRDFAM